MRMSQPALKRLFALTCFCLLVLTTLTAQTTIKGLRKGKLPNGLTYYIYNDGSDTKEAQYYLYQNVGAILENDAEIGLAHVLEHLAFNTTDHFPNGIMNFLRSNHLNEFEAFTGIDDTRYAVHNVPTTDEKLNQQMLFVLRDWCHGIKILPKDVEKERGIILEEWRHRAGIDRRITDAIAPVVYNHSRYAQRNVIGTQAILETFKGKEVKAFYDKWYRPNMQFIAIIGDVDIDKTEQAIIATFKSLPNQQAPAVASDVRSIANNTTPLYLSFVDKENKSASFGLYQRYEVRDDAPEEARTRQFLFTKFFNTLAPKRFAMLKNAEKEAFIAAEVSLSPLVRNYYQMAWDAVPYQGKEQQTLQQVLAIRHDLAEKGFTKEEFETEKNNLYNGMKDVLEAKGLGTPDNVLMLLKQNFLWGLPIQDFRTQINRNIETLVELEPEDLNSWLHGLLSNDNLAFVTYEKRPGELHLNEQTFLAALHHPQPTDIAFAPEKSIQKLIDFNITPGKIVAEKLLKTLQAKMWTLSNGAKVIYKYLPNAQQQFLFAGSAEGGKAMVAPNDLPNYTAMRALLMQSGLYRYNRNQLASWLQGKDLNLTLSLEDYTDGLGGNAPAQQADNFFAFAYLVLTRRNFSPTVFDKYLQRNRYLQANKATTGMEAVQDSIRQLLYPISPLNPQQNEAFFQAMQQDKLQAQFEAHFGNAARFTFCLVGNLPEAQARELVCRYLAALPGQSQTEKPTMHNLDFASKAPSIEHTFEADIEDDMAEIELSWRNDMKLTEREQSALEVLRSMVERRCFDVLREQEQLTYTIGVQANYNVQPAAPEDLSIHLSTASEHIARVTAFVRQTLDEMQAQKFSADAFKAAMIPLAVDEEAPQNPSTDNPSLWMGLLNIYAETGEELTPEESAKVAPIFRTLTPQDVAAVAKKVLSTARQREIIVRPKPQQGKRTFK